MADYDVIHDPQPQLPAVNDISGLAGRPTIANLKAALTAYNSTTYTADRLAARTYNDLVHACKLHGLTPTTTF